MEMQYFAVRWGDDIRISDHVFGEEAACRNCYGMCARVTSNDPERIKEAMHVAPIGTTKASVRSAMKAGLEKLPFVPMKPLAG